MFMAENLEFTKMLCILTFMATFLRQELGSDFLLPGTLEALVQR